MSSMPSQKSLLVVVIILVALYIFFAHGKCSQRLINKCGPMDAAGEALEDIGDALKK